MIYHNKDDDHYCNNSSETNYINTRIDTIIKNKTGSKCDIYTKVDTNI